MSLLKLQASADDKNPRFLMPADTCDPERVSTSPPQITKASPSVAASAPNRPGRSFGPNDRKKNVEHFQNDKDARIFLTSLRAGGVGLNLTEADYDEMAAALTLLN